MILYGHALSSASYRVRIALALKGLQVTSMLLDLRGGEQRLEGFLKINSQGFVPALALDDGAVLTQSVAIIEYLDEIHPDSAAAAAGAFGARASAGAVAGDHLRCASLEQFAGAAISRKRFGARQGGAGYLVPALGAAWGSTLWSAGWFETRRRGDSATVMRRPWRMCAWCPRYSMHGALRWTLVRIHASWESTPLAGKCRSFKAPLRTGRYERPGPVGGMTIPLESIPSFTQAEALAAAKRDYRHSGNGCRLAERAGPEFPDHRCRRRQIGFENRQFERSAGCCWIFKIRPCGGSRARRRVAACSRSFAPCRARISEHSQPQDGYRSLRAAADLDRRRGAGRNVRAAHALFESIGACMARIDAALCEFSHPAMHRVLQWDLRQAGMARENAGLLPRDRRARVEGIFSQWEGIEWTALRHSVIHGDANDHNVIVADGRMVGTARFRRHGLHRHGLRPGHRARLHHARRTGAAVGGVARNPRFPSPLFVDRSGTGGTISLDIVPPRNERLLFGP